MERKTVTIKGQAYNLPPLSTGQMRKGAGPMLAAINALSIKDAGEAITALPEIMGQHAELLAMALQNEYPHITQDDVESMIWPDLQAAVGDLLKVSGLVGRQGEVKPQGTQSL